MSQFNLNEYPLWTALVTPFTDSGEVDYDDLLKLLKQQEEAKNAILILGSTGEALNIDLTTRKKIVEFACSQNLNVPLMVGVGGSLIQSCVDWVEWLNNQAIHSLLLVTPLYAKPGRRGQTAWFQKLLDTAKLPCVLYNVPGRTAVAMHIETVKDVIKHPNFFGIKEASGSVEKFSEYCRAAEGKVMYCGDDGLMPEFTQAGAKGLISVASNVWPKETNLYVQQNLNNTFKDKEIWTEAANSLFLASNPVPAKMLLAERGDIKTATLQLPLHVSDLEDLYPVMDNNTKITEWFKNQN
jgi:4-hydroxy-tetrahydrodipicolinate synthase